jgi:plasmid stability protein
MVDILVRNVDDATAAELKKKAKAQGKSVNDLAREALKAAAKPGKEEAWAAADAFRKKIGRISGDSTADIREDRDSGWGRDHGDSDDNDERHR